MTKLKRLIIAELPPLAVATGLGIIFGVGIDAAKGGMLFLVVFLILQPFVLAPLFRRSSR